MDGTWDEYTCDVMISHDLDDDNSTRIKEKNTHEFRLSHIVRQDIYLYAHPANKFCVDNSE